MTTVYISGPMSGYPELNFPAFDDAVHKWTLAGHAVVSPHEIENDQDDWNACIKNDLIQMLACDAIVMLNGWEDSRGATLELFVATQAGMEVRYDDDR